MWMCSCNYHIKVHEMFISEIYYIRKIFDIPKISTFIFLRTIKIFNGYWISRNPSGKNRRGLILSKCIISNSNNSETIILYGYTYTESVSAFNFWYVTSCTIFLSSSNYFQIYVWAVWNISKTKINFRGKSLCLSRFLMVTGNCLLLRVELVSPPNSSSPIGKWGTLECLVLKHLLMTKQDECISMVKLYKLVKKIGWKKAIY